MFNKIWYPDETLVAVSGIAPHLVLAPLFLLVFVVSYEVILALAILVYILGGVVRVRGAITLQLDKEEAEQAKLIRKNGKRVVISVGIIIAVLLLAAGWLFPDYVYPVLPAVLVIFFVLLLGMFGLTPKSTAITASIAIVLSMLIAGIVFSWKLAVMTGALPILFFFPGSLAVSIKTDRLLKGDLEGKLAPGT